MILYDIASNIHLVEHGFEEVMENSLKTRRRSPSGPPPPTHVLLLFILCGKRRARTARPPTISMAQAETFPHTEYLHFAPRA